MNKNGRVYLYIVLILGLVLFCTARAEPVEPSAKYYMYATLLSSSSVDDLALAARSIEYYEEDSIEVIDLVATRFLLSSLTYLSKPLYGVDLKLLKFIKASKNSRYQFILQETLNNYKREYRGANVKGLVRKINKVLKKIKGDPEKVFKPEVYSLKEWQDAVSVDYAVTSDLHNKFLAVKEGDSLDTVLEVLSAPSMLTEYKKSTYLPFHQYRKSVNFDFVIPSSRQGNNVGVSQFLNFHYREVGNIKFFPDEEEWVVSNVSSNVPYDSYGNDVDKDETISRVMSNDPLLLKTTAMKLYKRKNYDEVLLIAAANRLLFDQQPRDDELVDALAWLSKYLGSSKNLKFRTFFYDYSMNTSSNKLKKYASKALELIPKSGEEQFVIGN